MTEEPPRTFRKDFKRFFIRGLAVLLPSVLTLWILVKAYQFIDLAIAQPINAGIRTAMIEIAVRWPAFESVFVPDDSVINQEVIRRVAASESSATVTAVRHDILSAEINSWWSSWSLYLDWIGILVAVVGVYVAGRLVGGFLGRHIYRRLERLITSVPLFKQIYPYVKRIVDFLFSEDKSIKFSRVVIVQYPRKGIWSVGLVTGETMRAIQAESGEAITVFIPSSPTPFTGYTITVPRSEALELPISIDEALLFTISGGVLVPEHQAIIESSTGSSEQREITNPPTPGEKATGSQHEPDSDPGGAPS